MNAIIKVENRHIGEGEIQTVNARELHAFLCVGTSFKDWLPRRIDEFGFVEGIDFTSSFLSVDDGGSGRKEFYVSLDMAKELAMVERNEKGKQARMYFIECERRVKSNVIDILANPAKLREALLSYTEKVVSLEAKVEEQRPAVEFVGRYVEAKSSKCLSNVAKLLKWNPRRHATFRFGG